MDRCEKLRNCSVIRMMDLQITKKFSSSKIKGYRLNSHVRSVRMGKSAIRDGTVQFFLSS